MSSSESEEDEFMLARYGTPMEELDDPDIPKKPIAVHEQVVTDAQGRRRFHGAFTGGFSAGYYNTVDTEEGWTPSMFKSSRSDRGKNKKFVPEDFMDEEDLSEYGIAPQKIVPQTKFASDEKNKTENKGRFAKNATMLLGMDMIQSLVIAVSSNVGTTLLQKMGWKPGQGIGPKVKKMKKSNIFIPENVEFAPDDCIPIEFNAKADVFGLGYTGMDPKLALHDKVKKSSEIAIRTKSGAKLSFVGQAFGVGAYEDEDQDIYAQDSMANYDLEMTEEKKDSNYGWTKPSKAIGGPDQKLAIAGAPKILQNFEKSEKSTRRKNYPPPLLPPDYDAFKRSKVMQEYGEFGDSRSQVTYAEERERKFHRLDPNDRGEILGEKPKIEESIKFDEKDSVFTLLKPSDRQRLQIMKHGGVGQPLPVVQKPPKRSGFYEPFASNPLKQKRYEAYLDLLRKKEAEPYSKMERDPNMTEWEMQQEREEFMKSSRFFQPLSATMSSRFAPESESLKHENEKEIAQKEAAKMKMFGMLTRDAFEWHPDSLLCKRFNVPNPYPNSDIVGVPGQDSGRLEMFLHPDDVKQKKTVDIGSKNTGIVKDIKNPLLLNRDITKSVSRWDAKPVEQIVAQKPEDDMVNTMNTSKSAQQDKLIDPADTTQASTETDSDSAESADDSSEEIEKTERPPMDIFRAIFADSDSSDSDDEEVLTRSSKMKKSDESHPNDDFRTQNSKTKRADESHADNNLSKAKSNVNKPQFHKFSLPSKQHAEIPVVSQECGSLEKTDSTPMETLEPASHPSSLVLEENAENKPLFHRFLPKTERLMAKRPNDEMSETDSTPDLFGPVLPPIKIPKILEMNETNDKKSKKSKHKKKKKHKKDKKKK